MKRILMSLVMIALTTTMVAGATKAYVSDNETSDNNTFSAGSLDLTVDGGNINVVKFNVNGMKPGSQPHGSYTLANVGSINGFLDLENVSVTDNENGCVEPESSAGDTTCDNPGAGQGELGSVVNLRLFVDRNGDGWISAGDTVFYNGKVSDVPTNFELNEPVNAGSSTKIVALLDWWSTPDDNKAQGDSMTLNLGFELAQTTGQ